jgi:Tfp pilus assembly protein PilF
VLQREPQNEDAILGLTEIYSAQGNKDAARAELAKLPAAQNGQPLSLNMQRRIAMAQAGLGDSAAAEQTFNKIIPQAKSQPAPWKMRWCYVMPRVSRRKTASLSRRWKPIKTRWCLLASPRRVRWTTTVYPSDA